jgi:hypothetical protein
MTAAVNPSYKECKNNEKLDHIPGSFGLPIIGQTFQLVKDLYGTIDRQYHTAMLAASAWRVSAAHC